MSQTPVSPKFRIAICGAGPGGLALAATLVHFSDPSAPVLIDLYEAAPEIGNVGAGIGVHPRTRNMLDRIGLADDFRKEMNAVTGHDESFRPTEPETSAVTFRKADQEKGGFDFYVLKIPAPYMIHRSVLVNVIQKAIQYNSFCTIHTSSRFVSYEEIIPHVSDESPNPSIRIHFSNGSTGMADVLIGADGVHSAVRSSLFSHVASENIHWENQDAEAQWSGTIAYRSLISGDALEKVWPGHEAGKRVTIFCGKGKHVVTYPINGGTLINIVAYYTFLGQEETNFKGKSLRDVPVAELKACYAGWEPRVQAILQCVDKVSAWAIDIVPELPHCTLGSAAIIGDAAHAMETHFGAGAGQAMEVHYFHVNSDQKFET